MHHGTVITHEASRLTITRRSITANSRGVPATIVNVIDQRVIILVTEVKETATSESRSVFSSANSVRPPGIETHANVKERVWRPTIRSRPVSRTSLAGSRDGRRPATTRLPTVCMSVTYTRRSARTASATKTASMTTARLHGETHRLRRDTTSVTTTVTPTA